MTKLDMVVEAQYYIAFCLQIVIAVSMVRQSLQHKARYFFAYIVWQTFSVAVTFAITHLLPYKYFWYSYWINNAITISLGLAIVTELFARIFEPYAGIRRIAKIALLTCAAALIVIGMAISTSHKVEFTDPALTVLLVTERSVRVVQLGLLLSLFVLSRYLHLRWRNYLFGIALGFGFYALLALAFLTVRMYYGRPVAVLVNTLLGSAYCGAVAIWTFYVLQPEAATVPIVSLPSHELQRWDSALSKFLGRK